MTATTSKPRLIDEDSTSCNMNDYMRNIILAKVGTSDSRVPTIVQDNARSFASSRLHPKQTIKAPLNQEARSTTSQDSKIDTGDSSRWESNALPAHVADSKRYIQQRWSNGTRGTVKDSSPFDDRADKKRRMQKNLTASLARDLNISRDSHGSNVFPFEADDEPKEVFSSAPTMHNSNHHISLVRPERIPSSECFWNTEERRSFPLMNSQTSSRSRVQTRNYRWGATSEQASKKVPSSSNKSIYTTPQA